MKRALLTIALLTTPAAAMAQTAEDPRTIVVNATGTVEREPDQAVIMVAVETLAPTALAAADSNATKMAQVTAALRRVGVPAARIRTVSYELHPEYVREERANPNAPPRIAAYRAVNMVQVTVDSISRVGAVIDNSISAGANRVTSINFQLRDHHAAHLEALRLAVQKARREAEVVAEAAGQRLGAPLSINTGGYMPPPMPMARDYAMRAEMAMSVPTPVEAGQLTVMANVNIVYRIESP